MNKKKRNKDMSEEMYTIIFCVITLAILIAVTIWLRQFQSLVIINVMACIVLFNMLVRAINKEFYNRHGRYIIMYPNLALLILFGMIAIVGFTVMIFISAFRSNEETKPYYKAWDLVYEEKYDEALEKFNKYDRDTHTDDARDSIRFCNICIYFRDEEYYKVITELEYLDRENSGKDPHFETTKQRQFYNKKMKVIRAYIDAHGQEIRRKNMQELLDQAAHKIELEKRQKKADEEYRRELAKQPYPEKGMTEAELETTCLGKATKDGWSEYNLVDSHGKETVWSISGFRYSFEFKNDKNRTVYAYVDDGKVIYVCEIRETNKKNISNSNSGYSGSTKSKSKSKDQMNCDIDGYYNDYKNSDGFVDEDDAWDDFEDNDAWEDY